MNRSGFRGKPPYSPDRAATIWVSLFALLTLPTHAASLVSLGQLADAPGVSSAATAVSADGSAVVGYADTLTGKQAFRWTEAGGMVGLGWLTGATAHSSEANGVSADGLSVVGNSINESTDIQALVWTPTGGMIGLADPGGIESKALGIAANSSVVVGGYWSAFGFQACRWTDSQGLEGLGDFPGGLYESAARAGSGDGSVIAGYGRSTSGYEAFRWTQTEGMVGLGDLPGGIFDSSASAISRDGLTIVGGSQSAQGFEAFRWTQSEGILGLGDGPGGAFWSLAKGVGANGAIIVGYSESFQGREACLWSSADGLQRLWDALVNRGVDPTSAGWSSLSKANAVSADGRYVVGFGIRSGRQEAFLADLSPVESLVPELNGLSYSSGSLGFQLAGVTGLHYVIETSTNLVIWLPVETNAAPFVHTSSVAAGQHMKFLRAFLRP
jgi:probable HAF family extracellular repeat protein